VADWRALAIRVPLARGHSGDREIAHPHDALAPVPDRLPAADVRALSVLSPARALGAIALEWLGIAAAITTATFIDAWPMTILAIVYIGARQHALAVIAHDASHFRLLPNRRWNDWVGNVFLAWPTFMSVQGFRHFHAAHHRFLSDRGDGNRELWHTHGPDGELAPEWRYPKTPLGLAWKILRRATFLTGLLWIVRGLIGSFLYGARIAAQVVRVLLWAAFLAVIARAHAWRGLVMYWVVPYCTWHVAAQYARLVCEHSAVRSSDPRYAKTRTTVAGSLGRLLVLPRNVGYHLEHHTYPSVPFYRLPELHARFARDPGFSAHARVSRSLWESLRECTSRH
jgi:fatty acid desaturase